MGSRVAAAASAAAAALQQLAASAGGPGWLAAAAAATGFAALYWKGLPLVYHARALSFIVAHQLWGSKARSPLDPAVHEETVSLSDMDWNVHMNNAQYALLGDHVRIKLFQRMYSSLREYRALPVYNAGVTTLFLREFRFRDRVVCTARLVAYERRKWAFVALAYTHGRTKRLHALGLTKMCWKEASGKTVPPQEALARMGYAMPPELRHGGAGGGGGGASGGDVDYTALLTQLQAQLEADLGFPPAAPPVTPPAAGGDEPSAAAAASGGGGGSGGGAGAVPRQRK
jgi:acyl-CoA thioesterase FadM